MHEKEYLEVTDNNSTQVRDISTGKVCGYVDNNDQRIVNARTNRAARRSQRMLEKQARRSYSAMFSARAVIVPDMSIDHCAHDGMQSDFDGEVPTETCDRIIGGR